VGGLKQGICTANEPREDSDIKTVNKCREKHSSEKKWKRDKGSRLIYLFGKRGGGKSEDPK
jgi:hypothetical protein